MLPPGEHELTVEFLEPGDKVVAKLTKHITIRVADAARDTAVFVSDASTTPQSQ